MEPLFTLLTIHEVKPPVTGEFPHELSIMRRIDVFCNISLNTLLNKHSSYWWYQPHDANAISLWGIITLYLLPVTAFSEETAPHTVACCVQFLVTI